MSNLHITILDDGNKSWNADLLATDQGVSHPPQESNVTDNQAISLGYEIFRLLHQLSPSAKRIYLDEIKRYGRDAAFTFQSDADLDTRNFCEGEFIHQFALAPDSGDLMNGIALGDNRQILDSAVRDDVMWTEPPVDTMNPNLLDKGAVDWDGTVYDNGMRTDSSQHAVSDADRSVTDKRGGLLMPSPKASSQSNHFSPNLAMTDTMVDALSVDDTGELQQGNPGSKTSLFENVNSPSDPCMDLHGQKNSNFVVGLPTPPSDSHSPSPAMDSQSMSCASLMSFSTGNPKRRKSSHRKVQKSPKRPRRMENLPSGPKILHLLSNRNLEDDLKCGRGLVRDDLSAYLDQNFNTWQKQNFWPDRSLTHSVSNVSTDKRVAQVFQLVQGQTSDQKLWLHFLLFLSFETLKKEIGQNNKNAATLAVERLLKSRYPERWDTMVAEEKDKKRQNFHDTKRIGFRCCLAAGVLGLGVLLGGGETLTKVLKTHRTYSIDKLKIVLAYIRNAHPGVVGTYHILDDLTKHILCGSAFTTQPTEVAWQEKIRVAAVVPKTLQQLEEDWEDVDFDVKFKKLVKEFC